jgi:hypothetical protein
MIKTLASQDRPAIQVAAASASADLTQRNFCGCGIAPDEPGLLENKLKMNNVTEEPRCPPFAIRYIQRGSFAGVIAESDQSEWGAGEGGGLN